MIEESSGAGRSPHHACASQPVTPVCGDRGENRGALSTCWRVTPGNGVWQKVSHLRYAHRCARGRRGRSFAGCSIFRSKSMHANNCRHAYLALAKPTIFGYTPYTEVINAHCPRGTPMAT